MGGLIGSAIAKKLESKNRDSTKSLSMDQMIAGDTSSNFGVPYDQVESMKLSKRSLVMKGSIEARYGANKKKYALGKDEYNLLKGVLPTISSLSGKVEVKQ